MRGSFGRFNTLDGRSIPQYVDAHKATLTFPEKLMYMIMAVERAYVGRESKTAPISWVKQGTVIFLLDEDELLRKWLPQFFEKSIKLSSFLRKCYRWGFRRLSVGSDELSSVRPLIENAVYIWCEWFQRDNPDLLYNMESTTSVKTRTRHARHFSSGANQTTESASEPEPATRANGTDEPGKPAAQDRTTSQQDQPKVSRSLGSVTVAGPLFPPSQHLMVYPPTIIPPQLQVVQVQTGIPMPIIGNIPLAFPHSGILNGPSMGAVGNVLRPDSTSTFTAVSSSSAALATIPAHYPALSQNRGINSLARPVPAAQRTWYTDHLRSLEATLGIHGLGNVVQPAALSTHPGFLGVGLDSVPTNMPLVDRSRGSRLLGAADSHGEEQSVHSSVHPT